MTHDFGEQYRDPRWQRMRLRVFEVYGWACNRCQNDKLMLVVHHRRYRRGAKVWEYAIEDLECLCDLCHAMHHNKPHPLRAAREAWEQLMGYHMGACAIATDLGITPTEEWYESKVRELCTSDGADYGRLMAAYEGRE